MFVKQQEDGSYDRLPFLDAAKKHLLPPTPATDIPVLEEALDPTKIVFAFQSEAVAACPGGNIPFIGTGELTTCMAFFLHCPCGEECTAPVVCGHADSQLLNEADLQSWIARVDEAHAQPPETLVLDIIGGFDDVKHESTQTQLRIGEAFDAKTQRKIELALFSTIRSNTQIVNPQSRGDDGKRPIATDVAMDLKTKQIYRVKIDGEFPGELFRRCLSCFGDQRLFLDRADQSIELESVTFPVNPMGVMWLDLDDQDFLHNISTSPYAEAPKFVPTMKQVIGHIYRTAQHNLVQLEGSRWKFELGKWVEIEAETEASS